MEHLWLFPWVGLVIGIASALAGVFLLRSPAGTDSAADAEKPGGWRFASIAVWLAASVLLFIACLHIGSVAGVDLIGGRGYVLGTAAGLVLAWICRRASVRPAAQAPVLFGVTVAVVAAGRLWLTHGEATGLVSLGLGAAVTILCLAIVPAFLTDSDEDDRLAARATATALLFLVALAASVQIGFTRAGDTAHMYWADMPLLVGAALALGVLVGAALSRGERPVWLALCSLIAGAIVAIPLSAKVAASWDFAGVLLLGAVLFLISQALARRAAGEAENPLFGLLAGLLLLAAGATVSFAIWSGYGLALFALGGWLACGASAILPRPQDADVPSRAIASLGGFSFVALLLVYRLATLQDAESMRSRGPGDIWDLFAICLGALIPWMASEWNVAQGETGVLPAPLLMVQWLLAAVLPALVLDYIWRPRALAGLFLGIALAQILAAAASRAPARLAAASATCLVTALALLDFLPWMEQIGSPTRMVRLAVILVLAILIAVRIAFPGRERRSLTPAAQEA